MKKFLLYILFLSPVLLKAQTGDSLHKAASEQIKQGNYSGAARLLRMLIARDSSDAAANYQLGVIYLHSRSQRPQALPFLLIASLYYNEGRNLAVPSDVFLFLGDAYQESGLLAKAATTYENYKLLLSSKGDTSLFSALDWKIKACRIAGQLGSGEVTDSSGGNSYSISTDGSSMTLKVSKDNAENIVVPGSVLIVSPPECHTADSLRKEAAIGTSVDGQVILTYRDDHGQANLYSSCLNGNLWTTPEKILHIMNAAGWEEDEFITADGSTMFFTSAQAGGYGGKDIYRSALLPGGEWSRPVNMGPQINSPYDDEAPFMYPDGKTFIFSSNGRKNPGCFDIYKTQLLPGDEWTAPVSVGFPATSSAENGLSVNADATLSAAINNKQGSAGNLEGDKSDFLITFRDQHDNSLNLLKGRCFAGIAGQGCEVIISDNRNAGKSLIYHTDDLGRYSILIPPGNINITYKAKGALFHSENVNTSLSGGFFEFHRPVELPLVTEGAAILLNNLFFHPSSETIDPASETELKNILQLLKDHPSIRISIIHYNIDPSFSSRENARLAYLRTMNIRSALCAQGVSAERIEIEGYSRNRAGSLLPKEKLEEMKGKHLEWTELRIIN